MRSTERQIEQRNVNRRTLRRRFADIRSDFLWDPSERVGLCVNDKSFPFATHDVPSAVCLAIGTGGASLLLCGAAGAACDERVPFGGARASAHAAATRAELARGV
eukprot:4515634-Pleurochrysis_carterae.AAC.2